MRLSAALLLFLSLPAFASIAPIPRDTLESPVALEAAYRVKAANGAVIVILQSAEELIHPELASGNRAFYGDASDLWQLDAAVPAELGQADTALSFFRAVKNGHDLSGNLTLSPASGQLECSPGSAPSELGRLSGDEQAEIEHKIAAGAVRLHPLPQIIEPLYLFTPANSPASSGGEFVFVSAPVFNFHDDYQVAIGPKRHAREIAVASDFRSWRMDTPGEIRFASGGGVTIPLTIDLVPKADRDHRGSPTLIRDARAKLEVLTVPKLPQAKAEIESFGFGRPLFAHLHTPCDPSLKGNPALVQVSPKP